MTRLLAALIIWIVALIPTWLWIGLRFLVHPVGFWQNFAFLGLGLFCLGAIQLILAIIGFIMTAAVYDVT